jgi:hypothetical protein
VDAGFLAIGSAEEFCLSGNADFGGLDVFIGVDFALRAEGVGEATDGFDGGGVGSQDIVGEDEVEEEAFEEAVDWAGFEDGQIVGVDVGEGLDWVRWSE